MNKQHQRILRIGSRTSDLALRQTHAIMAELKVHWPHLPMQVCPLDTLGDAVQNQSIAALGKSHGEGVFNKALEQALLNDQIDLATASLKDVEGQLANGVKVVCVGKREDPRDALVSVQGYTLANLPAKARLGCSSPRRIGQLKALRQDIEAMPLRGNVPTRIGQGLQHYDGIVLAAAGLIRLGLQGRVSQFFSPDAILPAPGQGALAVEFMSKRSDVATWITPLEHLPTQCCTYAERALLRTLSGGCFAPVGALANVEKDGSMRLEGRVVSLDGRKKIEGVAQGRLLDWKRTARRLGEQLLAQGARRLIEDLRQHLARQA